MLGRFLRDPMEVLAVDHRLRLADMAAGLAAAADFLMALAGARRPPLGGASVSAVHIEWTAYRVLQGDVFADQRWFVVRGGVEPPTFRFSGGRSYRLSYLTLGDAAQGSYRCGPDGI
jgi:hypothetical protein